MALVWEDGESHYFTQITLESSNTPNYPDLSSKDGVPEDPAGDRPPQGHGRCVRPSWDGTWEVGLLSPVLGPCGFLRSMTQAVRSSWRYSKS